MFKRMRKTLNCGPGAPGRKKGAPILFFDLCKAGGGHSPEFTLFILDHIPHGCRAGHLDGLDAPVVPPPVKREVPPGDIQVLGLGQDMFEIFGFHTGDQAIVFGPVELQQNLSRAPKQCLGS